MERTGYTVAVLSFLKTKLAFLYHHIRNASLMEVNRQTPAKVLIRRLSNNESGGITSLFRLNVVTDCTPVNLNQALLRLIITPASRVITQFSLNNASITLLSYELQFPRL